MVDIKECYKFDLGAKGLSRFLVDTMTVTNCMYDFTYERIICFSIVSEDGASIYSASPEAEAELPSLDITLRGAGKYLPFSISQTFTQNYLWLWKLNKVYREKSMSILIFRIIKLVDN